MCLDRLLVGLRAIVNATCESLATVVGAPSTPCTTASASVRSSHTAKALSRSTLFDAAVDFVVVVRDRVVAVVVLGVRFRFCSCTVL